VDAFLDFVLAQDPAAVILLLMLISALENVFPPLPADVATALGAFWAVRAGISPVLVGLLCFVGNQISAFGIYFWARAEGEAVLRSPAFRSLLPLEMQPVVRRHLERFGSAGIFISRFLPGLRAGVLPFAAINGLSPLKALGPASLATLIWYLALTAVGSALGLAYDEVRNTVARATGLLGFVGLTLAVVGTALLWRAGRRARAGKPPTN
jgi:membrane protein DedA with SNARE-associated domain